MAKKNKNNSSDYVGFRAKNEKQKEEFYNRSKTLKENGFSKADIFEAGLLALEKGNSKEQLKRKKDKDINERDSYLRKDKELNNHIEAINRQFVFKYGFKEYYVKDNVLNIDVTDKEGNEYNIQ